MKRRSMYSEPSRGLLRKFGEERPRRSGDGLCAVGDGPAMCASPLAAFSYRPAGRRRAERVSREGRRESLDRHPRLFHDLTCFGLSMKFSRSQRIKSSELRGVPCRTSTRHSRDRVYNVPPQLTHTFTSTTLIGRTLLAAPTAIVHSHAAKWLGHCHCAALPPSPPRLHVLSRRVRGALASLPHLKSVAAGPPAAAGAAGAGAAGAAGF